MISKDPASRFNELNVLILRKLKEDVAVTGKVTQRFHTKRISIKVGTKYF